MEDEGVGLRSKRAHASPEPSEAGDRRAPGIVGWALVASGVLVAAVAVVALVVVVSGDRTGTAGTSARTAVGSESRPVPLGKPGGVGSGWRLTVRSVTRDAQALLGPLPHPTPKKAEEILVSVVVGYSGPEDEPLTKLLARTYVAGSRPVAYSPDAGDLNCIERTGDPMHAPRPLNQVTAHIFSGTRIAGHLCFEVAHRDANALRLFVDPPGCRPSTSTPRCERQVWFALRPASAHHDKSPS